MTDSRTITNGNSKSIKIMIDPANTIQCSNTHVEWKVSLNQWYRLVAESDNTQWKNEEGLTVLFTCAAAFRTAVTYPGLRTGEPTPTMTEPKILMEHLRPETLVNICADLEHWKVEKKYERLYTPAFYMLHSHVGKKEARAMINKKLKENF